LTAILLAVSIFSSGGGCEQDGVQSIPDEPVNLPVEESKTPEVEPAVTVIETSTAELSFAGDITLGDNYGANRFGSVFEQNGAAYFLSGVSKIFANDDLTISNLEGPLTDSNAYRPKDGGAVPGTPDYFWLKGLPSYVNILSNGSVEAVNLANNHSADYGETGLNDTKNALNSANIDYFGYEELLVREVNGIKIGFFGMAFNNNVDEITDKITRLRADGAEVVVATFHDGVHYVQYTPTESQRLAAYRAIDAGADLVVEHHPHVLQGTEEYKGKFIAYSLGNFCYGGHSNPQDKDTMILSVTITKTGDDISIEETVIPASISSFTDRNDYRPRILEGDEAARVLGRVQEMSDQLD
jgi:poly-gamma-glutamate synthesis protein (capsule biosynthesis protein)